jgi:hypothetical protein
MWLNFVHIFSRVLRGMPLLVSSNWAAWLVGIGAFVFSQVIVLIRSGWREMLRRWKENIGIGLISAAAVYLFLFAWSAIQTVYDDHHDSGSRWQAVVKEKKNLKDELQKRDNYIRALEDRKCPTCTLARPAMGQGAAPQAPPPMVGSVRIASQKTVVSTNPKFPYALEVILQTDASIEPVAFGIECDGDIGDADAIFVNGGMMVQTKNGFLNKSTKLWGFEWSSPAFTPDKPIAITVFSKTYVRVVKLQQLRYSWP